MVIISGISTNILKPIMYLDKNKEGWTDNCSSVTEFIFLGITDNTVNKLILFTMVLFVYLINLLANLGMITLIRMDPQLHTPMYFFLSHLSFCDLCCSTAISPKMMVDRFAKNKSISFYGCALQFLVFLMACDWDKAISNPLLYSVSMSSRVCSLLMSGVFLVGITVSQIHTPLPFHLCFCGSNVINLFFCGLPPFFFPLSCSDTQVNELYYFRSPCSYFYIILSVLKIHSAEGKVKDFTTCTFHLTAVSIFQGTLLFMYFRPSSSYCLDEDKMTSLFYTRVIPLLSPLIFSLWNKDVKEASLWQWHGDTLLFHENS
ncbi:hypothetical protein AB1E18_010972 [Capra hircus]